MGTTTRPFDSYLGNQLHVTIFYTVMDHLHIMAGAFVTNPVAAWFAVAFGGYRLEDVLDEGPCFLIASRHKTRSVASTFLTTRYPCANESKSLFFQSFRSAVGVGIMRVAAINDDISWFNERQQQIDEIVDWLSSHDEEHDAPWLLEPQTELLHGMCTNDMLVPYSDTISIECQVCLKPMLPGQRTFGFIFQETVDLGDCPVEDHDGKIMVGNVQNQILTHYGQTNEAEVTTGNDPRGSADIDAGQTGATVSPLIQSTQSMIDKLYVE